MKILFFALLTTVSLISCKKESTTPTVKKHTKSVYMVGAIEKGGDTTFGPAMFARTETVGLLVVEDSKLKVVLTGFYKLPNGQGVFTIAATNKMACRAKIRWGWEDLRVDSIAYPSGDPLDPKNDVVQAGETKIFTVYGDAKVGKIKMKAEGDCGNSSTLILQITVAILPIKLVHNTATYDENTGKTTVSFTLEDPSNIDWLLIQKQLVTLEWEQLMIIGCDHVTKNYSIKL
jgi:hypothetical protein